MSTNRTFSVAEVNALIPRLDAVFQRLTELRREIGARANEIERLGFGPLREPGPEPAEILERREILLRRVKELEVEVDRVGELGGILTDIDLGLVDFPAEVGGERVFLCWQFGEPEVSHYHAIDAGFAGRRALVGLKSAPIH
ncbi:MAG: DUF2203 domain-containing protein [Myxococcota bacterium]